jgi:exopolysaccharide biosynthesis polyprenyl glycosylphosphotransferase
MRQKPLWRLRATERRVVLFSGDILAAMLSLFLALYVWGSTDWLDFSWDFLNQRVETWIYFLPVLWLLMMTELYDLRRASNRAETVRGVAIAAAVWAIIYLVVFFLAPKGTLPRRGVAAFFISAPVLTLLWRFIYINIFTAPLFMRRVMVVGAGRGGCELVTVIKGIWPPPFYLVGLLDDDPEKKGQYVADVQVLGGSRELFDLIGEYHVTDLVFAISGPMNPDTFQRMLEAEEQGIEITSMPLMYEELLGRVPIFLLQSDWVLRSFIDQSHASSFYEVTKRLIDILGGLVGLIGFLAFLPLVSVAIFLDSGWPVIYSQERLGRNNKLYRILKFRTMYQDAEKDGRARPAIENDDRVTRVGRLLRKSHLDELPQFLNILRGEMSLVGPRAERPELVAELQQSIPFYRARLFVKPGLTGWAQVNFGYAADTKANAIKLEYDLYYIKHRNLVLDLMILLRTFGTVFGLRGQ